MNIEVLPTSLPHIRLNVVSFSFQVSLCIIPRHNKPYCIDGRITVGSDSDEEVDQVNLRSILETKKTVCDLISENDSTLFVHVPISSVACGA